MQNIQDKNKYGNILAIAPTGEKMFRCNEKKCNWYISRGLAKKEIKAEETILQLLFQPKGFGNVKVHVLLEKRDNVCAICGTTENLRKRHLIPREYFILYPEEIKSHRSDCLILCCFKHGKELDLLYNKYREFLAKQCKAPLKGIGLKRDYHLDEIVRAAYALMDRKNKIPERILENKRQIVQNYLQREFSEEDLIKLCAIKHDDCVDKTNYESHAQLLMKQIKNPETFIESWKAYFVTHMKPKFLPIHLKYLEK